MEGDSWRGLSTNQKGAIAVAVISAEAAKHGIAVSRPTYDARYDLIFDLGKSLLRIQCKCGALDQDGGVLKVGLQTCWHTPTGYVRNPYATGEVDFFAVYCGVQDRCYLLPADRLAGRRAVYSTFRAPK
jgi:hypothetical protein